MKNWTGNQNSIYKTLGASNHTEEEREENDYYATEPKATEVLLEVEKFKNVLEPACGEGHIKNVLVANGISVRFSDIVKRENCLQKDFFDYKMWDGDIVTNPPYKYAKEFIEHALSIVRVGDKIAMFLKLQFLEGKKRKELFTMHPPKVLYVSSSRLQCAKNGDFEGMKKGGGGAVAYGWYVWVKGNEKDTVIKWVN